MLQKFFEDTLETTFIKSLVYNTPLPIYDTVSRGDFLVKGACYIYINYVIKCLRSGYITDDTYDKMVSEMAIGDEVNGNASSECSFVVINHYHFGEFIPNITKRNICNTSYYNSDTHRWFGDYLRCYRDIYGIDLMGMYNCFNYTLVDNFQITGGETKYKLEQNNNYKILSVPIKFNKTYTIAVDCLNSLSVFPVLYSRVGMLQEGVTDEFTIDKLEEFHVTTFTGLSFRNPKTFRIDTDDINIYRYQKYLYLFIQLPRSNNSSVVVLEGDYTKPKHYVISAVTDDGEPSFEYISSEHLNKVLYTRPHLLLMNDNVTYAFNSKIIGYLNHHVINNREFIDKNISRVQELIGYKPEHMGIWSNKLRYLIFSKYTGLDIEDTTEKTKHLVKYNHQLDTNGFIDKEVERYLNDAHTSTVNPNYKYFISTETETDDNGATVTYIITVTSGECGEQEIPYSMYHDIMEKCKHWPSTPEGYPEGTEYRLTTELKWVLHIPIE